MPWDIKHTPGAHKPWAIVRADTGEVVGHSYTKEQALSAVRARYANTPMEQTHDKASMPSMPMRKGP